MAVQRKGSNPWLSIWTKPRMTIAAIVAKNPKAHFILLSGLYGFPTLLQMAQTLSLGQSMSLMNIVIGALILSFFVGMLGITIASGLIYWTGKWIGGKSSYYPIRAAVSWANVPHIVSILMWVILILTFKNETFIDGLGQKTLQGNQQLIIFITSLVLLVVSVWSLVILVKGVAQVQGFSAWKGLLNVLIPFFMVAALVWVLSWIMVMISGMPTH